MDLQVPHLSMSLHVESHPQGTLGILGWELVVLSIGENPPSMPLYHLRADLHPGLWMAVTTLCPAEPSLINWWQFAG